MDVPSRYRARFRVRFDEAGADGHLRPSGLLRYAQDAAWQHSEASGFGREWYAVRDLAWLVRHVRLRMHRAVGYGATVSAVTEVTGWRRVWAHRHAELCTDGEAIGEVDTDWVLVTSAGRPTRIPDEIARLFAPGRSYTPDHLELEATPAGARERDIEVRASDVDPLGHLNHAAYLDLVEAAITDLVPGANPAGELDARLEFVRPARPGRLVRVSAWTRAGDPTDVAVRMRETDGNELARATARLPASRSR